MARVEVFAPIPGTFYRRPDPASPPFAEEGSQVRAGDTICLIEVMKNFNPVPAGTDGTLVGFLVEDEDVVSPGQAVALIEDGT
ncbi:MAG: acetyl-CoA carboxylase [Acidimicrobiia bacterium]